MQFGLAIDTYSLVLAVFYGLLFLFTVYGVFLAYHWYTFGTSKQTSTVALATYLGGGAILFVILAMSINMMPF